MTVQTLETSLTDSQVTSVELRRVPVTVPSSGVTLSVSVDSLLRLPVGASYSQQSGQSRVKIRREPVGVAGGEVIVVEATCDSLQLVCEEYVRTIRQLRQSLAQRAGSVQEVVDRRSNGIWKDVALLVLSALVLAFFIKKIKY